MRRLVMGLGLGTQVVALFSACGGVVETREAERDPPAKSPSGAAGGSSKSSRSSTADPDADTDLGDCTPGAPESYSDDKPCAWVADMRCYDTRDMACNCVCPRNRDSQCVSGFEAGAYGHVWVACN